MDSFCPGGADKSKEFLTSAVLKQQNEIPKNKYNLLKNILKTD